MTSSDMMRCSVLEQTFRKTFLSYSPHIAIYKAKVCEITTIPFNWITNDKFAKSTVLWPTENYKYMSYCNIKATDN